MDISYLVKVVTLIVVVSTATERLVELVKGWFPGIAKEIPKDQNDPDGEKELRRQYKLHWLALLGGIITSCLAYKPIDAALGIKDGDTGPTVLTILLIGLCASGGSSFWNSILGYLTKVKDIKAEDATQAKAKTGAVTAAAHADKAEADAKAAMHRAASLHLKQTLEGMAANPAYSKDVQNNAAAAAKQISNA